MSFKDTIVFPLLAAMRAGVQREIQLEEIEEAVERSHPEFFVPTWPTPLCLCTPGTPPSTRNLPPGYNRGGKYDKDPFRSGGARPRLPLLSLPADPLVPNPCHDPIFGNPDANHRPGQGGGFPGMPGRRTGGGRFLGGGGGT